MGELIDKALHDRLVALAEDAQACYDTLEPLFAEWRKARAADYQFKALSDAQEAAADLSRLIRNLLGAVE